MQSKYRISGALFENQKDRGPAFTGTIEIEGNKYQVALWPKTSAKGTNYLQVSEDKKKPMPTGGGPQSGSPFKPRAQAAASPSANKTNSPFEDGDDGDSIPF